MRFYEFEAKKLLAKQGCGCRLAGRRSSRRTRAVSQ